MTVHGKKSKNLLKKPKTSDKGVHTMKSGLLDKRKVVNLLINYPVGYGKLAGFTKLKDLHNRWIKQMVSGCDDETLQAHRG